MVLYTVVCDGSYINRPRARATAGVPPMNLRAMTWNLTVQKLFFSQEKDLVFYKQLSTYIKINYYEKDIVISVCYCYAW
jgi:hypothetical protein